MTGVAGGCGRPLGHGQGCLHPRFTMAGDGAEDHIRARFQLSDVEALRVARIEIGRGRTAFEGQVVDHGAVIGHTERRGPGSDFAGSGDGELTQRELDHLGLGGVAVRGSLGRTTPAERHDRSQHRHCGTHDRDDDQKLVERSCGTGVTLLITSWSHRGTVQVAQSGSVGTYGPNRLLRRCVILDGS